MRKFSKLEIIVSHEGNDESEFSTSSVEMTNGSAFVQVGNFESALGLLPPGSEVSVVAKGTVGNRTVHELSRMIRESTLRVALDLSAVTELSRVVDSPFRKNQNLIGMIFPCNLRSINPDAFAECIHLESVMIPPTVQIIGKQAFLGCEQLSLLKFCEPDGWTAESEGKEPLAVFNLEDAEENPRHFVHKSSPYRNCVLKRIQDSNESM